MADIAHLVNGAASRGLVKITVYRLRPAPDEAWACTCLFDEGVEPRTTHSTRRTPLRAMEVALAPPATTEDIFG